MNSDDFLTHFSVEISIFNRPWTLLHWLSFVAQRACADSMKFAPVSTALLAIQAVYHTFRDVG
jgi:hypothetical protein